MAEEDPVNHKHKSKHKICEHHFVSFRSAYVALGCGWLADDTTKEKDLHANKNSVIPKVCITSTLIISLFHSTYVASECGWLADGTTKEKDLRAKHGAVIKACIRSASIISCPFVQHALRQENDMHFQVGVAASTLLERTFPAKTSWKRVSFCRTTCDFSWFGPSFHRTTCVPSWCRPRSMQTGWCQG